MLTKKKHKHAEAIDVLQRAVADRERLIHLCDEILSCIAAPRNHGCTVAMLHDECGARWTNCLRTLEADHE